MEWYEKIPSRWKTEKEIVNQFLKNVTVGFGEKGQAFFIGTFRVLSAHGHLYGDFRIKIVYPSGFPERGLAPSVYLLSHQKQWKNGVNGHIEKDWKLCLFIPGESEINFRQNDSLKCMFVCLYTFLIKESFYQFALIRQELTGEPAVWPGPARSHGIEGIREMIREYGPVGRKDPCPCGSGKRFEKCCMGKIGG